MRGLALFLAAAASAEKVAVKSDSVKGVITLLEGLLKNSEKESKETAEVYDKTACSCRDNLRSMTREFEETQKEIDRQTNISKDFAAQSDALNTKLNKHVGKKEAMEKAVAKSFANLKAETKAAGQVTQNFHEETDAAMEAEIQEIGTINQPYLKGLIQVDSTNLSIERAKCNERLRKAEEMMAACDKVLKALEGAQSKKIIEMVKTLKQHAFDRKTAIQEGENECQSKIYDLEKAISSNSNFLELSEKSSAMIEAEKAEVDAGLAKANEEIAELTGARDALKEEVKETNTDCKDAATDYDAHSALLQEEIAGLTGAISALKKVPGPETPAEFLQLAQSTAGSVLARVDSSISTIAERATTMHSGRLATFALQLRLGNKAQGPDFFESVRSMIVTMVQRLEDEQTAETSKTDWCASTLAELKSGKKDSSVAHEGAVTAVRSSEAIIAQKTDEMNSKKSEKAEAEGVLAEMKDLAAEKSKMYTDQEAEKSMGESALKEAIGFLQKIYEGEGSGARAAGPTGSVKTRATNGGGIIKMLTGIMEDYAWDADVANMEMQCNEGETYKARAGDTSSSCTDGVSRQGAATDPPTPVRASELLQLQKDITTKIGEIATLKGEIDILDGAIKDEKNTLADGIKTRDEKKGVLESAISALKARQEACVNANDSFEARQKRREEEIAALKDALAILETHSKNSELGAAGSSFLAVRKSA